MSAADVQVPFLSLALYVWPLPAKAKTMFEGGTTRCYEVRPLYVMCVSMTDKQ